MSLLTRLDDLGPALDAVLAHWALVNQERGGRDITLANGYTRRDFLNEAVTLEHSAEEVQKATAIREQRAKDLAVDKEALKDRLVSFCLTARALLDGSHMADEIPRVPAFAAHEKIFIKAMEDAAELWRRYNARQSSNPMILGDGTKRSDFVTGITIVRGSFKARDQALARERELRKRRTDIVKSLRARAVQYRRMIQGSFPADHPLVESLPRISPEKKVAPMTLALEDIRTRAEAI